MGKIDKSKLRKIRRLKMPEPNRKKRDWFFTFYQEEVAQRMRNKSKLYPWAAKAVNQNC